MMVKHKLLVGGIAVGVIALLYKRASAARAASGQAPQDLVSWFTGGNVTLPPCAAGTQPWPKSGGSVFCYETRGADVTVTGGDPLDGSSTPTGPVTAPDQPSGPITSPDQL